MYEAREYRHRFNSSRFASFTLHYRDTDLWIGVDHASFNVAMAGVVQQVVEEAWQQLEAYISRHGEFLTSHLPVSTLPGAPVEAEAMSKAAARAGTGPMAAVAGLFAWLVGETLRKCFSPKEIVVENGGDFYLLLEKELVMTIYAGRSPLNEKIGVAIPPEATPCGVCTSSGIVGHSFSYGKADAVMVACQSPLSADAWATALANRILTPGDISQVLTYSENFPEIISLVIICEDKAGIRGNFEARFVKK